MRQPPTFSYNDFAYPTEETHLFSDAPKSALTAQAILALLSDRQGFDDWWESIDSDTQIEIAEEIEAIVS